jgi:serine phosphatase RsbU (regulator of sigma subunit)
MIVDNIHSINNSLGRITAGNLDEVVDVRSSEEFISLSDDINNTVDTLKHYIDEAAARIDRELEFAREIQYSSLPSIFPPFPKHKEFDIFASMDTAKEVGGDFYDFYFVGPDKLAFLVADVSGKGIPAAMFMMRARAVIKALAETGATVDEIFSDANDTLCQGNERGMFVTAWLGILDIHTGEMDFANGGHTPPYILHPDGSGEWVKKKSGIMLGSLEDVPYAPRHLTLKPGDIIYVYTDGVPENANEAGEFFGEERLEQTLLASGGMDLAPLCIRVKEELDAFTGGAEQFDDITMLALRYTGEAAE